MRAVTIVVAVLAASAGRARAEAPRPASLEDCDARVAAQPGALASYRCYWSVARNTADWAGAAARLEACLGRDPANTHARLILGAIAADRGDGRAEPLLREAAEAYGRAGAAEEEVHARVTLAVYLRRHGDHAAAKAQLERALARAESTARGGDAPLAAGVRIQLGWQEYYERDYGAAWTQLKRAESVVFPSGTVFERLDTLDGLAATAWALGRQDEALTLYRRQLDLLGTTDPWRAAFVRRNALLVLRELVDAGERDEAELRDAAREALAAARAAGNRLAETGARLVLAERLPPVADEQALEHARAALEIARATSHTSDEVWALRVLAERGPVAAAPSRLDEAVALARDVADAEAGVAAQAARARVAWAGADRARALAETQAALDAVERVRDLQPDREVRARVFARFAGLYREAVDRVLSSSGTPPAAADVAAAFAIAERLRARALLDTLDAAGVTAGLAAGAPAARERESVLARIADVQRRLVAADLPRAERAARLNELDALELREQELRDALARADPRFAALRRPAIPRLEEIQAALGPAEALLAFVVPHTPPAPPAPPASSGGQRTDARRHPGGGAWVFVVSRAGATAVRLDDPAGLDREARLYVALLARRDGAERAGAPRLYARLLAPALAALPAGVTRLVVVPDGALNGLPLETLRASASGPFLAETFATSIAPSATAWLRLRSAAVPRAAVPLLAFADPALPLASRPRADVERLAGTLREGVRAGPLPHARREARRLARALGGGDVRTGGDASERALKSADLGRYALLHFAAHGLLDEMRPERSAVLLAGDAVAGEDVAGEDGLLQYREILDLRLHGQLVLLSSCRGASGPLVGGEGTMGLASAFLQAGAGAVVASLWPLRDAEAADFVEDLGRRLGTGATIADALADARRAAIARGDPPAAWAALALYGNGNLAPWARATPPRRGDEGWSVVRAAALALAVAGATASIAGLVVGAWRRRRRGRPRAGRPA